MVEYSGFLSNFMSNSGSSGSYTDIMSKAVNSSATYNSNHTYDARFFNLGNILIQFTQAVETINNLSTDTHTIEFPTNFGGPPWCVVASPSSGDGDKSGYITVRTDSFTSTQFNVMVNNTGTQGIGITYIAIGPGPS